MAQPLLKITHVATGLAVAFDQYGFNEFQDTIDTKYNSVNAYGRMDPIVNYQGSTRKISLGIEIFSSGDNDAFEGVMSGEDIHLIISRLQKMQYPVYAMGSNALTIQRPPIVSVSLANLIRDGDGGELLCAMNGFAFTPKVGFTPEDSPYIRFGSKEEGGEAKGALAGGVFTFQRYNLKFDFTVLHRHAPGFTNDSAFAKITDSDKHMYSADSSQTFIGGFMFGPASRANVENAVFAPAEGPLSEQAAVASEVIDTGESLDEPVDPYGTSYDAPTGGGPGTPGSEFGAGYPGTGAQIYSPGDTAGGS